MKESEELFAIAEELFEAAAKPDFTSLDSLVDAANEVGKSWCGSWWGYHSRVYYDAFQPAPPGAHFSIEEGLTDYLYPETVGDWAEYDFDFVVEVIREKAGDANLTEYDEQAKDAAELLDDCKARVLSILSTALQEWESDGFIQDLVNSTKKSKPLRASAYVQYVAPSGGVISRDTVAIQAGPQIPPHISVLSQAMAIRSVFTKCEELGKLASRAASHLDNLSRRKAREERIGTNVFIGHGRSRIWKELKDFIQDRLRLPWDEFNRIPAAGVTNIERLSKMLDEAAFAFLILTAEDEQADGKVQARMNVIHEVGLFQGRLGFAKAIVLLEDDCEEFSNISGLGQVRFKKGEIEAVFEEIRKVLEREGLLGE